MVPFKLFLSIILLLACCKANGIGGNNVKSTKADEISKIAKDACEKYEQGQKDLIKAKRHFEKAKCYEKQAKWLKINAREYNRRVDQVFLDWLKKEHIRGNISVYYKNIISDVNLLPKYQKEFMNKYSSINKNIMESEIKTEKDVTDSKMWICLSKTISLMLK